MSDEMVNNLKRPSAWLRALFMIGFVIALYVVGVILLALILAQLVFSLLTGADNINLRRLGESLSIYVSQILAFLTYNSEIKPFPFLPFPVSVADVTADVAVHVDEVGRPDIQPAKAEVDSQTVGADYNTDSQLVADDDGFRNSPETEADADRPAPTAGPGPYG